MLLAVTELVDKELPMGSVGGCLVLHPNVITDCGEHEHQRRQSLLAVHNEPALHPACGQRWARGQHDRADEVARPAGGGGHALGLLEQVSPELG